MRVGVTVFRSQRNNLGHEITGGRAPQILPVFRPPPGPLLGLLPGSTLYSLPPLPPLPSVPRPLRRFFRHCIRRF